MTYSFKKFAVISLAASLIKLLVVTSITLSGLLVSSHSHRCDAHVLEGNAKAESCCLVPPKHPPIPMTSSDQFVGGSALDQDCVLCRLLAQFQVDAPAVNQLSLKNLSVLESISVASVFLEAVHFRQAGRAPPRLSRFCSSFFVLQTKMFDARKLRCHRCGDQSNEQKFSVAVF